MQSESEELGSLIALYRLGKPGSEENLLSWLHGFVRRTTKQQSWLVPAGIDREDMASDVTIWLCAGLPKILANVDLNLNLRGYIWKVVYMRLLRRAEQLSRRLKIEELERESYKAWHPLPIVPSALDLVATEELRTIAMDCVVRSIRGFRFPRFKRSYARMVDHWLRTGEEFIQKKQGDTMLPTVVKDAARYRLRRTISNVLVRSYLAGTT